MGNDASKVAGVDETEDAPPPVRNATGGRGFLLYDKEFQRKAGKHYDIYKREIVRLQLSDKNQACLPDPNFRADNSSLYYSAQPLEFFKGLKWQRVKNISPGAQFMKDGIVTDDVIQGKLGDCWFLASVAAICRDPRFINKVLPRTQEIPLLGYLGYYYARFWRFGEWIAVVINDKLPTKQGKLVFGQCRDPTEFWCPLLEKAFASFHGSYEAIDGGFTVEALEDLTGGLALHYQLGNKTPRNLFKMMLKAFKNDTFMTCTYVGKNGEMGLIAKHAYTITGAHKVPITQGSVELVRIRNPYGDEEWTGDWSDSSALWEQIAPPIRTMLGYAKKEEGEFYMSFADFTKYFEDIKICSVGSDLDFDGSVVGDRWSVASVKGLWKPYSGGSRHDYRNCPENPQYYVHMKEADDFNALHDQPEDKGKCSFIIGLMQEDKRSKRKDGEKNFYLGIHVFKVNAKPFIKLSSNFFRRNKAVAGTTKYINYREVTLMDKVDPGHYVIVPSKFYRQKGGNYLIRLYTERKVQLEEIS